MAGEMDAFGDVIDDLSMTSKMAWIADREARCPGSSGQGPDRPILSEHDLPFLRPVLSGQVDRARWRGSAGPLRHALMPFSYGWRARRRGGGDVVASITGETAGHPPENLKRRIADLEGETFWKLRRSHPERKAVPSPGRPCSPAGSDRTAGSSAQDAVRLVRQRAMFAFWRRSRSPRCRSTVT